MDHVEKPRCRYVTNEHGEAVGWLVHGTGAKVYSIQGIDHALRRRFAMVLPKLLKGTATA